MNYIIEIIGKLALTGWLLFFTLLGIAMILWPDKEDPTGYKILGGLVMFATFGLSLLWAVLNIWN